jgi:hypothetical protein
MPRQMVDCQNAYADNQYIDESAELERNADFHRLQELEAEIKRLQELEKLQPRKFSAAPTTIHGSASGGAPQRLSRSGSVEKSVHSISPSRRVQFLNEGNY